MPYILLGLHFTRHITKHVAFDPRSLVSEKETISKTKMTSKACIQLYHFIFAQDARLHLCSWTSPVCSQAGSLVKLQTDQLLNATHSCFAKGKFFFFLERENTTVTITKHLKCDFKMLKLIIFFNFCCLLATLSHGLPILRMLPGCWYFWSLLIEPDI